MLVRDATAVGTWVVSAVLKLVAAVVVQEVVVAVADVLVASTGSRVT